MRKLPIFILLGATVILLILISLLTRHHKPPPPPPPPVQHVVAAPPTPPPLQVIGSTQILVSGNLLGPGQITALSVNKIVPGDIPYSQAALFRLYGDLLVRNVLPYTPITKDMLIAPDTYGYLTAVLKPGKQAITIPVLDVDSQSGMVWPGDHVDVILTMHLPNEHMAGHDLTATTIASNIRILAVNTTLGYGAGAQGGGVIPTHDFTLEVTPSQAKDILIAADIGSIRFTLLGLGKAGNPIANPPAPFYASQVSPVISNTDTDTVNIVTPSGVSQGYVVP